MPAPTPLSHLRLAATLLLGMAAGACAPFSNPSIAQLSHAKDPTDSARSFFSRSPRLFSSATGEFHSAAMDASLRDYDDRYAKDPVASQPWGNIEGCEPGSPPSFHCLLNTGKRALVEMRFKAAASGQWLQSVFFEMERTSENALWSVSRVFSSENAPVF